MKAIDGVRTLPWIFVKTRKATTTEMTGLTDQSPSKATSRA